MTARPTLLAVGATGSIGRFVVEEALSRGYAVRLLVRDPNRARRLGADVEIITGDLTRPETLGPAVRNVAAIVFTHGSDGSGKAGSQAVDYGGVRNILMALGSERPRVALMTSIGVTNRTSSYNRSTEAHDWKRRGERLLRASGLPYTIVRPGWFDYNDAGQQKLVFLQGDTRQSGTPRDGAVSRRQIAQVLVESLASDAALRKTFELVADAGPAPGNLDPLFSMLEADSGSGLDGIRDTPNMPLAEEPKSVLGDLQQVRGKTGAP